ncbi:hypothetical protein J7E50_16270 [Pedobacter sp. ISL-68]|uniref:hypothetical protein n=1 Tax=unclassified Pedobacter TaxID=2628915 RepID=UPI001BE7AE57|nr:MULTISPECIES: hypothetical protein [unclassified Pedobacter]MBT2564205.1 hypothetical protein [Pedobacter sp. ISL-64]MBT2591786.1 hypothetical protein [Pedobacter sp. ISL-68]
MENEENKKGAMQGNNHPKPTDDVQLEIETVIPSTEKETDKPGEPAQKTEEVNEEKAKLNDQEEEADSTEKPAEENKTDSDNKRDDIETITPST